MKISGVGNAEMVTAPAWSFEAFMLEVTSAEDEPGRTTVWVAKDSRMVVKIVAVIPRMNGAVLTSELTQ
jgi:hypothetical protein